MACYITHLVYKYIPCRGKQQEFNSQGHLTYHLPSPHPTAANSEPNRIGWTIAQDTDAEYPDYIDGYLGVDAGNNYISKVKPVRKAQWRELKQLNVGISCLIEDWTMWRMWRLSLREAFICWSLWAWICIGRQNLTSSIWDRSSNCQQTPSPKFVFVFDLFKRSIQAGITKGKWLSFSLPDGQSLDDYAIHMLFNIIIVFASSITESLSMEETMNKEKNECCCRWGL